MISIQILSKGEASLQQVLDSIWAQAVSECEVVIVDSTGRDWFSECHDHPNLHIVRTASGTRALEGRFLANLESTGEVRLMLDATRPLAPGALDQFQGLLTKYDMVILREGSIGDGPWVRLARIDRAITSSDENFRKSVEEKSGFLLPRLFKGELLTAALEHLRQVLGPDRFHSISYGEHHLIWEEALKLSSNVGISSSVVLSHFEDRTLMEILRKYRWYGKSQRELLSLLPGSTTSRLSSHRRSYDGIRVRTRISVLPLYAVRTLSFLSGYYWPRSIPRS
jgi:hypothetical protein